MTLQLMADSIEPDQIPVAYRENRNRGVLLYADGKYAATPAEASIWPRRNWISVTGLASAALHARFLDVERYDATAADWPAFRARRDELCHAGTVRGWPGVYCSIDPGPPYGVQQVADACIAAHQELPLHWFIAWYTQTAAPPTQVEVASRIKLLTGLEIDPATIWGCQYETGGHFDLSVIYQQADWA